MREVARLQERAREGRRWWLDGRGVAAVWWWRMAQEGDEGWGRDKGHKKQTTYFGKGRRGRLSMEHVVSRILA